MKNYIKEIRVGRGLSQEQLADLVKTTHQQIHYLESGKRKLTQEWIRRIADALKVSPLEISDGTEAAHAMARDDREQELLEAFRDLDDSAKAMYLHGLRTFKDAAPNKKTDPQPEKEKKTL